MRKKNMLSIWIIPLLTTPWTGTIKVYHLINFPLSLTCTPSLNSHCVLSYWLQTVRKQRKCSRGTMLRIWCNPCVSATSHLPRAFLRWLSMLNKHRLKTSVTLLLMLPIAVPKSPLWAQGLQKIKVGIKTK